MRRKRKSRSHGNQNGKPASHSSADLDGAGETGGQGTGPPPTSGAKPTAFDEHRTPKPRPSTAWQAAGVLALGCAFSSLMAALTVGGGASLKFWAFLALAGGLTLVALLCFTAHRTTNRGRWTTTTEVRIVPLEEEGD